VAHVSYTYSTLLRSVVTEFNVMQELLRHSTLRSTLDLYTQAVTPAKHAAQAAVVSLVFFDGAEDRSSLKERLLLCQDQNEGTKRARNVPLFAPAIVSKESA
jgi:hypothetical protein